ncbi:MAG: diphosphomevalonate decarboxylase [Myxococcales bacterium]|nr:diphosphomevalonate decarboxylase [Deltaproteobacteria bacterium]NNE19973.1 diphosphomevalonate decarboxylase [Myxococcales bacterium]
MSGPAMEASARACANIALAKYWGKADVKRNIPAVPSISLTLDQLVTETRVRFDPSLASDLVRLDGRRATEAEADRVVAMLDRVRREAGLRLKAQVSSHNHFPTAAGLASSASGFAALAASASAAAGIRFNARRLSALARASSASAARSIYGGFVELPAGRRGDSELAARPIAPPGHWNVRLVVALTDPGKKKVGSTEGMERSRKTSPYYQAWLGQAPKWSRRIKRAIKERDLDTLGEAMEQSTLGFHCCAITSAPPIFYWAPATLSALATVRALRERGVSAWATMDAGPHVKALCSVGDASRVRQALDRTQGVTRTWVAKPGPDVEVHR